MGNRIIPPHTRSKFTAARKKTNRFWEKSPRFHNRGGILNPHQWEILERFHRRYMINQVLDKVGRKIQFKLERHRTYQFGVIEESSDEMVVVRIINVKGRARNKKNKEGDKLVILRNYFGIVKFLKAESQKRLERNNVYNLDTLERWRAIYNDKYPEKAILYKREVKIIRMALNKAIKANEAKISDLSNDL